MSTQRNNVIMLGLITLALAALFGSPWATGVDGGTILSVAWLGLIGSGLAFLAFFYLLDRWGATRTALVAYLLPIVGIVLGVLVLREAVSPPMLVGTGLIIGGIALANSRYGHRRLIGRQPQDGRAGEPGAATDQPVGG